VAYRTALCARSGAARRRRHERLAAQSAPRSTEADRRDDLGAVIHEEVDRLPLRYRQAVVLCLLEGLTGWASRKWVGNFVQQRSSMGRPVFPTEWHARRYTMSRLELTPEQQAEARRIERILMESARDDIRSLAELLASKPDHQLLGGTEYEVRDRVHRIGAKALETALDGRKKGGTRGPA
jgi:hypothetical protein